MEDSAEQALFQEISPEQPGPCPSARIIGVLTVEVEAAPRFVSAWDDVFVREELGVTNRTTNSDLVGLSRT